MPSRLEYHVLVRRFGSFSVALFGLLALAGVFVLPSHAQINGVPPSVTSPGFGGRAVNGTPPSVTSPGFGGRAINGTAPSVTSLGPIGYAPQGYAPGFGVTFSTSNTNHNGHRGTDGDGHHRHHHFVEYVPPVIYAPIPYAIDIGATDQEDDSDEADTYQGGPTIFDRRGRGAESYIPPVKDVRPRHTEPSPAEDADNDPPASESQEPTLLVFKDGRKIEVGNYAIVGATLFDLTPGHARKVAVSDLDLEATQKQNEDKGVIFRLPVSGQAN